ncbi:MAG: beta strand repeat-containing protein, partial [Sphaerospermopsis kisseleviana]
MRSFPRFSRSPSFQKTNLQTSNSYPMNTNKLLGQAIVIVASVLTPLHALDAATVTYTMQTGNFNSLQTTFNNNPPYAGTYNNGATELAQYANTGSFGNTPGAAAFETFTTTGNGTTGSVRALQVGDTFTITAYTGANPSSGGYIGISFRDSTTYSSFANATDAATEARFQLDNSGGWKIYNSGAARDSGLGSGADRTFVIKITSDTTFDASIGGTWYYNNTMAASGGTIDSFAIYTYGDSNQNSFWKSASLADTGTVEVGYALANGSTFNPGTIANGLAANSTSTVRTNALSVGGDAGSVVVLDDANTYGGGTTINANATARAANNNALSTNGTVTVASGGALQMSNNINVARDITLNGTGVSSSGGALRNVSGNNTNSGAITLGSGSRINTDSGTLTLSGGISGGANVLFVGGVSNTVVNSAISGGGASQDGTTTSLYKDGASTLTLSGNNTYTGDTRISAGRITVGSGGNLGSGSDVFIASGASLAVDASATIASVQEWGTSNGGTAIVGSGATLTVNGNAYSTYMNSISGSGALTKSGTGTMNLYGTQGYTGATTVSGGTLSSGVAMSTTNITVSGGTFETSADNVIADGAVVTVNSGALTVGGSDTVASLSGSGGNVDIASGKTLTVNETGSASYAGGITNAGGLTKIGAGTTTLSGANTYTGTTTIGGGTLALSGGNAIANTGVVTLSNLSGATLAVNASETIGSLRGGGATGGNVSVASSQVLTVAETGSQSYDGAISGAGGFTKSGAGTVTLSRNSSYSGTTTVSAGRLNYNATNTSTAVSISSGGTLAGTGSVGATTVNSGGTMSPGNSPGTQTYSSLTWECGGNYNWQLYDANWAAGTGYDTFTSTGAFAINANSGSKFNINLWTLSSISPSDVNGNAINFT